MRATLLLVLALAACGTRERADCRGPLVLAASDLREALPELAELHRHATGCAPVLSFGSSGQLAAQIEQGAGVDLFFSANAGFIDRLEEQGLLVANTRRDYGIGRLVLVHAEGAPRLPFEALGDARVRHLSIAHPEHAPYGMAAREALQSAGLWQAVASRVDASLHAPLRQVAAVPAAAADPEGGLAFLERVVGPLGREVLARHGFQLPEDP